MKMLLMMQHDDGTFLDNFVSEMLSSEQLSIETKSVYQLGFNSGTPWLTFTVH